VVVTLQIRPAVLPMTRLANLFLFPKIRMESKGLTKLVAVIAGNVEIEVPLQVFHLFGRAPGSAGKSFNVIS